MTTFTHRYPIDAALCGVGRRLVRNRYTRVYFTVAGVLAAAIVLSLVYADMIVATIFITALAISIGLVVGTLARAEAQRSRGLSRMCDVQAEIAINDDGLRIVLPDQDTFVRWSVVRELWCARHAWLVIKHDRNEPVIVAATAFADDAAEFARKQAAAAGATIVERA